MDPSIERTADGDIVVHPLSQGLCPRYDSIAKLAVRVDAEPAIVAKADALREVLHRVLTDCAPPTLMTLSWQAFRVFDFEYGGKIQERDLDTLLRCGFVWQARSVVAVLHEPSLPTWQVASCVESTRTRGALSH